MKADFAEVAALLGALAEIPARLAALERAEAQSAATLEAVRVALPPALATISEAAAAFKVSIPTMRRWVKRGEVPTVKIGNTVRVDLSRLHGKDAGQIAGEATDARRPAPMHSVPLAVKCQTK
jgi:excisionase family DNA binding protein